MAIRRSRYLPPVFVSTRGQSALKQRGYAMPTRIPYYSSSLQSLYSSSTVPSRATSLALDSRVEDYLLSDRVSDAYYLSNSTLDLTDDTVRRSRGRDQQLLRDATNAIPRGSVRDTATVTSSAAPFGPRRFPHRFGRARFRKGPSSSPYGANSLSANETKGGSTADVMASVGPAPSNRLGRFRASRYASVTKPYLELEDADSSPERPSYSSRARSLDPPFSTSLRQYRRPPVTSFSRRSLPPVPVSSLSKSKLLGSSPTGARSLSPSGTSFTSAPVHPGYDPLYVQYEPDSKPLPRRRHRVLATARRPAGNYYERLLRKRSKRQGRFGPYYDLESIEGSDLSGILSDVDSLDGTYDVDSDNETSGVSPSSYHDLTTTVSPTSPYYVDQDTEFVPFKPSRPIQTKGLLELSPYDDEDEEYSNSNSLPSPTTDLSLSRYLPSNLLTSSASSVLPSRPSFQSLVPYTSSLANDSLSTLCPPSESQQLLESLVASSVLRARNALNDLAIPAYSGASLLLSVEGAGLSPEGKRIGFTYTPPPIPLVGRGLRLDDKLLGLRPTSTLKPIDNFLKGYLERMGALRSALYGSLDRDKSRRSQYNLKPLETSSSRWQNSLKPLETSSSRWQNSLKPLETSSRPSATPIPSYTQSYNYVPVKHLRSQKLEQLPVTTFRRRQEDGRTQRLDVISLGEIQPRFSDSSKRAITIPSSATGGYELSVLDKINIKVSSESYATPQVSVASRRVARGRSLAPRAASLPPRPLSIEVDSIQATPTKTSTTTATASQIYSPRAIRPIILYAAAPSARRAARAMSVPPVLVLREPERRQKVQFSSVDADWRSRVRAKSVPPARIASPPPIRRRRYRGAGYRARPVMAVSQVPLPTAGLRAHKVPRRFLTRSGMRTGFTSLWGYLQEARNDKGRKEGERSGIRRSVTRARVLASPVARATLARSTARIIQTLPPPKPRPARESLSGFPKVYVPLKGPKPSNRSKAAIIASKLEPDPIKRRRPRSEYAANKYRALRKEAKESVYTTPGRTSGLYSSVPPLPKPSDRKAIRTEDGYSKPKNLLSWQYRLDSIMAPSDLLYQPSSLIRIREQVRDAQERMDRHRQMLDRYLPESGADSGDVKTGILRRMAEMEKRDTVSYRIGGGADSRRATVKVPSYYATGVDSSNHPVSDLRRRIKKTLNKTRYSTN